MFPVFVAALDAFVDGVNRGCTIRERCCPIISACNVHERPVGVTEVPRCAGTQPSLESMEPKPCQCPQRRRPTAAQPCARLVPVVPSFFGFLSVSVVVFVFVFPVFVDRVGPAATIWRAEVRVRLQGSAGLLVAGVRVGCARDRR